MEKTCILENEAKGVAPNKNIWKSVSQAELLRKSRTACWDLASILLNSSKSGQNVQNFRLTLLTDVLYLTLTI
jgi:hypothetical protein